MIAIKYFANGNNKIFIFEQQQRQLTNVWKLKKKKTKSKLKQTTTTKPLNNQMKKLANKVLRKTKSAQVKIKTHTHI